MSKRRENILIVLLSLIYTIFIIIGKSFYESNSFKYFLNNLIINLILIVIIFVIFFIIIKRSFSFLNNMK